MELYHSQLMSVLQCYSVGVPDLNLVRRICDAFGRPTVLVKLKSTAFRPLPSSPKILILLQTLTS